MQKASNNQNKLEDEQRKAILAAINEFKNYPTNIKQPSISKLAKDYGIAKTTLKHAIDNDGPPKRPGPPTVLTEYEESQLVGYCMNMQRLGFGLTKSGVNYCVMEIMRSNKRPHSFGDDGPGRDWWTRFMKDHPELSFRVPKTYQKLGHKEPMQQSLETILINSNK